MRPVNILFAARPASWTRYEEPLKRAMRDAGIKADLRTEFDAGDVDYIVYAPDSTVQDFTPFVRTRAVLSLWAGVEGIVGNTTLRIPLTRMVDDSLTRGMVEWVAGHVLRHHLGMDAHIRGLNGEWRVDVPPLARDRRVTLLGLGALGRACALALAGLGFDVAGWSRGAKDIDGITCLNGAAGLATALERADILILLLPRTTATENIMNATTLAQLPKGAVILNPGRGALIDDAALLAALDKGDVGHATLDTFRIEPLPADHSYWSHPRVTVTPHLAAETRPESAARVIAENVRRGQAGEPFLHLVDRTLGY